MEFHYPFWSRGPITPRKVLYLVLFLFDLFFFNIYFLIEISIYNEYQFIRIFILVLIFI